MAIITKQANFTLPEDLLEELRQTIPKGEQSKVVSEALRNELKRIKFQKALDLSFGAWKGQRHPELANGSRAYIRKVRKSSRTTRSSGRD